MSWAARRRFIILLIVGSIVVTFLILIGIATFYKAPSCTDGQQNQDEAGVDCGGPCPYLCTADEQAPTVLFTKTIPNGVGRVDIAASVVNNNPNAAAKGVPYDITLYGADQVLIQHLSGFIDLPPAATVPVFVSAVKTGSQKVANAFLEIDSTVPKWYALASDPRLLPSVSNTTLGGTVSAPRVTATLSNSAVTALMNVPAVVLVRDMHGEVIGASQTLIQSIPAHGQAPATFTWNNPFAGVPASIEVVPIVALP